MLLGFSVPQSISGETNSLLYAWLQYGVTGLEVRAIIPNGGSCPHVLVNNDSIAMTQRATVSRRFPVVTCEVALRDSASSIQIATTRLKAPKTSPKRILVLGDTGCRVTSGWYQNCIGDGNGPPWAFPELAKAAFAEQPDLIIHLGDYIYREAACAVTTEPGCAGSPWGDQWSTWDADVFSPTSDLLNLAPWLFVRGNHEDCSRNFRGWSRFLDPRPFESVESNCRAFSAPYKVHLENLDILVLNTATESTVSNPTASVQKRYTLDFSQAAAAIEPGRRTWLVTHRPLWGVAPHWKNPLRLEVTDTLLQAALADTPSGAWPQEVELIMSGHVHLLESLRFPDERPMQLISGAGGTMGDHPVSAEAIVANPHVFSTLSMSPESFQSHPGSGYLLLSADLDGNWTATFKDMKGTKLLEVPIR